MIQNQRKRAGEMAAVRPDSDVFERTAARHGRSDQRESPQGDNADTIVRLRDVCVSYDLSGSILKNVTCSLPTGSYHFLTGASGAGKSTLLKLICLALPPTHGSLTVLGADSATISRRRLPALRRKIGIIFQDLRLLDHLSAFDNAALPLRVLGRPEPDVRRDVAEMLGWAGLGNVLHRRPSTLSSGQQQLVAVVRAVISRPRLLLADEPTGNVDDRMAMRLMLLFQELNRQGTTVLIATHNQQLISRVGADVLHLENGQIHLRRAEPATIAPPQAGERRSATRSA